MGVPAFFRWLSCKYPQVLSDVVELVGPYDQQLGDFGSIDPTQPNPNGREFDNLYLDMNGIIHPCTHPEDRPPPTTEEEMFEQVFHYIDRLVYMIRPRKLVYLAVDGVAPRAKINQQRSRRFRAAKEAEEKQKELLRIREEWKQQGLQVPELDPNHKPFDSNVITPGTPFMTRLSQALKQFIADRVAHDPAYNNISVIYSDASVPGEGEHKIAEFIRTQRAQPGYDPNTSHVLYGLDADLIMLALATHELQFYVLRERVFPTPQQPSSSSVSGALNAQDSSSDNLESNTIQNAAAIGARNSFQLLSIDILRECLEAEFREPLEIGFEMESSSSSCRPEKRTFDLERVVDDFVFLCFFVGNDFLPHLPSLDIREGAIDYLIELYKKLVPRIGYLSDDKGEIHFGRVRLFLKELACTEEYIFQRRKWEEEKKQKQQEERTAIAQRENKASIEARDEKSEELCTSGVKDASTNHNKSDNSQNFAVAESLKKRLEQVPSSSGVDETTIQPSPQPQEEKEQLVTEEDEEEEEEQLSNVECMLELTDEQVKEKFEKELKERLYKKKVVDSVQDNIRFGEQGWKERYYESKFHWSPQSEATERKKEELAFKYFEGLLWVMRYYYRGCISWSWYFPYHYAPFASDLAACPFEAESVKYERGKPFRPLEQLMAVLPPSSAKDVLPECLTRLMVDPDSELKPYYPEDFDIDLEGKRFVWQGVALLPFVDASLLENAVRKAEQALTWEEKQRNSIGESILATNKRTLLGQFISQLSIPQDTSQRAMVAAASEKIQCPCNLFGRLTRMAESSSNAVIQAYYYLPAMKHEHVPGLLPNVTLPLPRLEQREKYSITDGRTGWKTAWFGPLGFLAKKMISERQSKEDQWNRRGKVEPSLPHHHHHPQQVSLGIQSSHFAVVGEDRVGGTDQVFLPPSSIPLTSGNLYASPPSSVVGVASNNYYNSVAPPGLVFANPPTNPASNLLFPIHPCVQQAQMEFLQQIQESSRKRNNRNEDKKDRQAKRTKR